MTVDPLGLARCIVCTNAFVFDAALAWPDGRFVCNGCAADAIKDMDTVEVAQAVERARELRAQLDT